MLCPCLCEVHENILLLGKICSMPHGPLQAPLLDSLQRSAVLLCRFAKRQGIHIDNKACPRSWEGWGAAGLDEVGIVEEEEDIDSGEPW